MIYDYCCSICEHYQEEVHGMLERPVVMCEKCGSVSHKLICRDVKFCGVDGSGSLYNFVDVNTTGKPIQFTSKRQWQSHLKSHGLNDDCKQGTLKESDLRKSSMGKTKEEKRKDYKKAIAKVLQDNGTLAKYGK